MAKRLVYLKGWRYAAFVGGIAAAIGAACYPIIVAPMADPEPWREFSRNARQRADIRQEDIQPGNMKVWTDPFDRPGKPGNK